MLSLPGSLEAVTIAAVTEVASSFSWAPKCTRWTVVDVRKSVSSFDSLRLASLVEGARPLLGRLELVLLPLRPQVHRRRSDMRVPEAVAMPM